MKLSSSRWLASSALVLAVCAAAYASTRPQYGGVLRVEMSASVTSLDPSQPAAYPPQAAARERLLALIFDRLVTLDDRGLPQPQLALSWQHGSDHRRWQFWLQRLAKAHDGSEVTLGAVAAALRNANPDWNPRVLGDSLVIEFNEPRPNLLAELAQARNAIVLRRAEGTAMGTGPFRVSVWEPGRRLVVVANDDYWGGRPYLDEIRVELGRAPRDQLVSMELGRAELIEVALEEVRRARQDRRRVEVSAATELLALVFADSSAATDPRIRQALALSLDRVSMQAVLAQGQGEVARGLLPQWMSGYSFLFDEKADITQARRLRQQTRTPANLTLAYDSADALARAVAERVAVNAREAGITIQVFGENMAARPGNADVRLVRLRFAAPEPSAALAAIASATGQELARSLSYESQFEDMYRVERALLDEYRVIPLLHLPEAYALSPRVKDWRQPRAGGWRLADVWLEREP